jgi:hypothetical protein
MRWAEIRCARCGDTRTRPTSGYYINRRVYGRCPACQRRAWQVWNMTEAPPPKPQEERPERIPSPDTPYRGSPYRE